MPKIEVVVNGVTVFAAFPPDKGTKEYDAALAAGWPESIEGFKALAIAELSAAADFDDATPVVKKIHGASILSIVKNECAVYTDGIKVA